MSGSEGTAGGSVLWSLALTDTRGSKDRLRCGGGGDVLLGECGPDGDGWPHSGVW